MHNPVPPPIRCGKTTVLHGEPHTCGKIPGHAFGNDPRAASRRIHQDFETGARWPSTLDDDPLADFVRIQPRDAEEAL